MDNKTKYTIYFKNPDGSHHSTKTMDLDGYLHLLQSALKWDRHTEYDYHYPTGHFEVEKREIIYSTFHV